MRLREMATAFAFATNGNVFDKQDNIFYNKKQEKNNENYWYL